MCNGRLGVVRSVEQALCRLCFLHNGVYLMAVTGFI